MKIKENYSLLKHNTFGLDVKTRWFVEYESEEDILKLLSDEYFLSQPYFHIGSGSNLLFLEDFGGIILHSGISGLEIIAENEEFADIKAGSGMKWDDFAAYCVDKGWGGTENLSLIPGEVGAAAVQNIGAYGAEVRDLIREVHTYDTDTHEKKIFQNRDCSFSYRYSIFKENEYAGRYIITHVVFRLSKNPLCNIDYGNLKTGIPEGAEITPAEVRKAVIGVRESKLPDPKKIGNAGSFFMNPYLTMTDYEALKKEYSSVPHYPVSEDRVKVPAAWLIDQCGLKGKTVGNAGIHENQPLVIINKGGASGSEIALLAEEVKQTVMQKFGIELKPEVHYVGLLW